MVDEYVNRQEHIEFSRRLEEQNKRQDKRIELLEENVKEISRQTSSIEKLANNMESMCQEQKAQGARLEALEQRPIKRLNNAWRTVWTALISSGGSIAATLIIQAIVR